MTTSTARRLGRIRKAAIAALVALVAAACGGGGDDDAPAADATSATPTTSATSTAPADDEPAAGAATTAADSATTTPSSDTWDPGEVGIRLVQLLDRPVDVYVRTTGIVNAFAVDSGVSTSTVTFLIAPPEGGSLIVTEAGADDPECVIDCPHILAQISATVEEGPVRTVLLVEDDGAVSTLDLWEAPTADRLTFGNALVPADPATGLAVVLGIALEGADFGLRLGIDGSSGCLEPSNLQGVLIGGNQAPAFAYAGQAADLLLYDNTDRECAGPAVGGPFRVSGGPGTRTLVILTGTGGAMDAIVLPAVGDEDAAAAADDPSVGEASGSDSDRELAIELMAPEVELGLGIPSDQSACVAELLVDAIGAEVLLVDGGLIDLDQLPAEFEAPATEALIASVEACGVDPALFAG